MRPYPRSTALLALLLAGCGPRSDLTTSDAVKAANEKLEEVSPTMRGRLHEYDIVIRQETGKWQLIYGGGTGGITVDVDKKTGQATIVRVQQ